MLKHNEDHGIVLDNEYDEEANLTQGWSERHVVEYYCVDCKKFLYDKGDWVKISD